MKSSAETAADRYVEAAARHGACSLGGGSRATNAAHRDIVAALKELRKGPDKGVSVLSAALQSDDPSVAIWSALHLLPFKEEEAVSVLQRVAQSGVRLFAFEAKITLQEWHAGRLKID